MQLVFLPNYSNFSKQPEIFRILILVTKWNNVLHLKESLSSKDLATLYTMKWKLSLTYYVICMLQSKIHLKVCLHKINHNVLNGLLTILLYNVFIIAKCMRWKNFVVVKLNCNSLEIFVVEWLSCMVNTFIA